MGKTINLFLIIVLIISIVSCNKAKHSKEICINTELNGTWKLVQYFDSIESAKSISKFRINELSWHAILLQIDNDSCLALGSITSFKFKINQCNDTLARFNDFFEAKEENKLMYNMIKKNNSIEFVKIPNRNYRDTSDYIFVKTDDFTINTNQNRRSFNYQFDTLITNYFNENLLAGIYLNVNGDTINFLRNGKIVGLNQFDKYNVRNYFGTYHPFENKDVVNFEFNKKEYPYYWKFENDVLFLKEFIRDSTGDYFNLGTKEIKLKKINVTEQSAERQ